MDSNVKATFDVESKEGQMRVFNAKSGASKSMKDLDNGFEIEGNEVLLYKETVDSYGKPQEVVITVIFGTDGTSYASVSDTVAKASENLVDLIKNVELDTFKVKLVKAKSKAGNEFLNLQLVM